MTNDQFLKIRKKIIENDFGNLNNMQKKAVFSTEGPLLVLAGAGSGKTTVLINRIANIIKYGRAYSSEEINGVIDEEDEEILLRASIDPDTDLSRVESLLSVSPAYPWQILAITFTNKAANELKSRLSSKLGEKANDIWAFTFHSACVRILRRNADRIGYSSNFTIYDTDDSKRIIKECMKSLDLSNKVFAPKAVISEISNAKNSMISPEEYEDNAYSDYYKSNIAAIYKAYNNKLAAADSMDFDDLIYNTVRLFIENADILDYYQNKFRYILVDEYQDTNRLQYKLVSLLAGKHRNICVVGDDDQSIYRFRGATIENILNFEDEYTGSGVIRLEQNYRSTQTILDAANAVIANNRGRKGKNLWTDKGRGDKIEYYTAESDLEEGRFVADSVLKGIKKGAGYSDYAVLYRMNSQSALIEQAFIRNAIPYRIIGGNKFYDRKEIKDALSYLSVIVNPSDIVRLRRIINEPKRGIGDASVDGVVEISEALGIPVIEVMENAEQYPKLSRTAKKLNQFAAMINGFIEEADDLRPSGLLKKVLDESGYMTSLKLDRDRGEDREENIGQLISNMVNYETENEEADLNDFLQEVALMTDIDSYNEEQQNVVMMTVHSAKGLEFNNVFIVGMEESIFPSDLSLAEGDIGLEEERRLAYVAVTRAREKLYISNSKVRMLFGMTRYNPPSRFIGEIPESLIDMKQPKQKSYSSPASSFGGRSVNIPESGRKKPADSGFSGKVKKPNASGVTYRAGDAVIHDVFGEGVVISVTPIGNDCLLEISFLKGMTKKVMANYAPIKKA